MIPKLAQVEFAFGTIDAWRTEYLLLAQSGHSGPQFLTRRPAAKC
jgi:hypothetical protein